MRRVLLTGAAGFIGSHLLEHLARRGLPVVGTSHERPPPARPELCVPLDVTDAGAVAALFEEVRPGIVVHAAANKDVFACERDPAAARRINVAGTENVARACARHGCRLIAFSADYVFDGLKGSYTEEDAPNPVNVYGETKLLGEAAVRATLADHVVLRPSNVYGERNRGFLSFVIGELRGGRRVGVYRDSHNSPTSVLDLCRVVEALCGRGDAGTFHVAGPVRMSRWEFALAIAEAFGLDPALVEGVSAADAGEGVRRPPDSSLDSGRLSRALGLRCLDPRDGLRMMRRHPGRPGP